MRVEFRSLNLKPQSHIKTKKQVKNSNNNKKKANKKTNTTPSFSWCSACYRLFSCWASELPTGLQTRIASLLAGGECLAHILV